MNIKQEQLNVLFIGSGGREMIMAYLASMSPYVKKIFVTPGTDGFKEFAEVLGIKTSNFQGIKEAVLANGITRIIVGPEDPLIAGLVDFVQNDPELQAVKVRIFGPSAAASELEGSKDFTAKLCEKEGIPAPKTLSFTSTESVLAYLDFLNEYPIVLKVSGPAQGKGVRPCNSREEAKEFLAEIDSGKFGKSADIILVQEFIEGVEASIISIVDANGNEQSLIHTKDYKTVEAGSRYMTGGMGCFGPASHVTPEIEKRVDEKIGKPLIEAMEKRKTPYTGFIYKGIMIKPNDDSVLLEVNTRNGDPEAEVNLALLDSDFMEVIEAALDGKLDEMEIRWKQKKGICLILTSRGYGLPGGYEVGFPISGIFDARKMEVIVLPYGVKSDGKGGYLTDGGRVMALIALADTFEEAQRLVYAAREKIICGNLTCRYDVGDEAVEHERSLS